MLKKYLNCNNASKIFLNISLLTVFIYSTVLAMYLAMPPQGDPLYFVVEIGTLYLENIFCALSMTGPGYFLIRYICKENK